MGSYSLPGCLFVFCLFLQLIAQWNEIYGVFRGFVAVCLSVCLFVETIFVD